MLMLTLKYSPTDYSLHASPHLPPFPLQIHHAFALMRTFAPGENEICKMILWGFLHCFARCWNGPVVDVSRVDGTMDGWNYRRLASKCEAEYWSLFHEESRIRVLTTKEQPNLPHPPHRHRINDLCHAYQILPMFEHFSSLCLRYDVGQ